MKQLNIIFMGTPEFAVPTLKLLSNPEVYTRLKISIAAVYTQPPRPAGRGYSFKYSAVHALALELGLPVETPVSLRNDQAQEQFASYKPDLVIVVAYGQILPKQILDIPPYGCLNIHGSLLPRWRGAAPIQRAIMSGDNITGITLMKLDQGMDTGPELGKKSVVITSSTTSQDLIEELSKLGAELLLSSLNDYIEGILYPVPQSIEGITYAPKIEKKEGHLLWHSSAEVLDRQIRALSPRPGCYFVSNGEIIKIHQATIKDPLKIFPESQGGCVLNENFEIACQQGILCPEILQRAGGKALPLKEFLRGFHAPIGQKLV